MPLGTKEAKQIGIGRRGNLRDLLRGVNARIATMVVYNFDSEALRSNVQRLIENYNAEVARYDATRNGDPNVDDFVKTDPTSS